MNALIHIFCQIAHLANRLKSAYPHSDSASCFIVAHYDDLFSSVLNDLLYFLKGFVYCPASYSISSDVS